MVEFHAHEAEWTASTIDISDEGDKPSPVDALCAQDTARMSDRVFQNVDQSAISQVSASLAEQTDDSPAVAIESCDAETSDLSSSFSSVTSDDEDDSTINRRLREHQEGLPSFHKLDQDIKSMGVPAFLREYLHMHKYSAAELLVALDIPTSVEKVAEGKFSFTSYLRDHLSQTYAQSPSCGTSQEAARLIKSARKIMVITGAGISTSLGIPDFRSEHGIYSQMEKYNLCDPQEMFDIDLFLQDPSIFYDFCKQLIPDGNKRYSRTHAFIRLLQDQGRLLRLYTQNIDNIESHAGIEEDLLVQCHGSFRTFSCVTCLRSVPGDSMFASIKAGAIPKCTSCWPASPALPTVVTSISKSSKKRKRPAWHVDDSCDDENARYNDEEDENASYGVMKPDMTFFGEQLPSRFKTLISDDRRQADLIICIGTSLKVAPVAAIPRVVDSHVPQIFISREEATRDYIFDIELLGACDQLVTTLAEEAGWLDDLIKLSEHGSK